MFRLHEYRACHYFVLLFGSAILTLPNLGQPSLWDIDEGVNVEASREMLESGNFIVPKCNFQLRDAKPALLYWCQVAAYRAFGVSEFSARLPCAIAAAVAALLLYELGRAMYSPLAGLLAGIVLSSSCLSCALAHFANPDALLLCCTVLTFLAFWSGYVPRPGAEARRGRWFVPMGIACGLGMLAKGPVAFVLPGATIAIFLMWQRQLRLLLDRRNFYGVLAFLAVGAPWYLLVTIETRGEFARGFFLRNNFERFLEPMENHRGPFWYHLAVLPIGLAPWSIFLLPALGFAGRQLRGTIGTGSVWEGEAPAEPRLPARKEPRPPDRTCHRPTGEPQPERSATRFLTCWFVVYLIFFSVSATKLPNYALPVYPAVALVMARFFEGWRRSEISIRAWHQYAGFAGLCAVGLCAVIALLVVGGTWTVPIYAGPELPGLQRWAWIGLIPFMGGLVAWIAMARRNPTAALGAIVCSSVALIAVSVALPVLDVDEFKAVRGLVASAGTRQRDRDIRLASYQYTHPSLIYYSEREVKPLLTEEDVVTFMAHPMPVYLFVPEPSWRNIVERNPDLDRSPIARKWDLYRRCDVLVLSNQ